MDKNCVCVREMGDNQYKKSCFKQTLNQIFFAVGRKAKIEANNFNRLVFIIFFLIKLLSFAEKWYQHVRQVQASFRSMTNNRLTI